MFNQAAHQVDIVRLIGGGMVKTVRAATGAWDVERPTEGAYAALLMFEDGAFAVAQLRRLRPFRFRRFPGLDRRVGPKENNRARRKKRPRHAKVRR